MPLTKIFLNFFIEELRLFHHLQNQYTSVNQYRIYRLIAFLKISAAAVVISGDFVAMWVDKSPALINAVTN
jgi:hypothetical protein